MNRKFLISFGTLALTAWCIASPLRAQSTEGAPSQAPTSIFHVVPTPNENFDNELFAASASSPNDIWAVGESTMHFDGTKWTSFPAPMILGDNTGALQGVVDISPTSAWAVGNVGNGNSTQVIEQWNGTQWSVFPGPTFAPHDESLLFAATATSANDVWAMGALNLSDFNELKLLFEHFDGTSWTAATRPDPDGGFLFGASADATNDVWAVGYSGFVGHTAKGIIEHFNGTTWKSVPSAIVDGGKGTNQLNAVAALAPNDVWAVGISTPVVSPKQAATLTLIEHFDGTSWTVVPSPNVGPHSVSQNNTLLGITAVSATDIYAFGRVMAADGSGHQRTLVLHWNGTSWTIIPSPSPNKGNFRSDLLFAGVAPAPGSVWLFGDQNVAPHSDTLALHTTTGSAAKLRTDATE